ncbi:hypothetical protein HPB51_024873 [Rhipicephalus microplus]|uniref:Anoctamin n=1 Tax=Rhipicephalus microplus TaxID=6941 RepID=A0A9J6F8H2_RHIMP|nr:hypothetical protein HPB51_024873 [Rhipicephalus microplus]
MEHEMRNIWMTGSPAYDYCCCEDIVKRRLCSRYMTPNVTNVIPHVARVSEDSRLRALSRSAKEVDYVLVYECDDVSRSYQEAEWELHRRYRELYEDAMRSEGLQMDQEHIGEYVFLKVHCPLQRLCQEAENVRLDLPLEGLLIEDNIDDEEQQWIHEKVAAMFDMGVNSCTGTPHSNGSSAILPPLKCDRRGGVRTCDLWTHHVLTNIDITKDETSNPAEYHKKKGLSYLLMKNVYLDAFVVHERSALEPVWVPGEGPPSRPQPLSALKVTDSVHVLDDDRFSPMAPTAAGASGDTRAALDRQWRKLVGGQPLDSIRDYFGEKISFYFAWVGTFIASLVVPAVIGLGVFFFGVIEKVTSDKDVLKNDTNAANYTDVNAIIYAVDVIKAAGDTFLTPFFAFTVCLWGAKLVKVEACQLALCATAVSGDDVDYDEGQARSIPHTYVRFFPSKRMQVPTIRDDDDADDEDDQSGLCTG